MFSAMLFCLNGCHAQNEFQAVNEEGICRLDLSTSLLSLKQMCMAIAENDVPRLKKLTTEEGLEAIISDRGLASLQIDILFWMDAMENGRIYVSEKIESEKEYILCYVCVRSKVDADRKVNFRKGQWQLEISLVFRVGERIDLS